MSKLSASLLFGLTLALVGCSKEEPVTAGPGSTASSSSSAGGLKIVFIPKQSGNAYFKVVDKGFEDASKEMKADYVDSAPASGDATSQIPIVKDQIQRGVDVIALSANAADTLDSVLDQAKAKGITVVTTDADIVGNETHRDAAVLSLDAAEIGESQIKLIGSLIGNEGSIAILSTTPDAPNQNAWIAGMKEALKKPEYSKMKLVDIVYGNDEPEKSSTVCEGLLSTHPDLKGIISPTFAGLQGAAQTLKLAGVYPGGPKAVGKGIQLTGLCSPNMMKAYVKSGVVTAFQLWNPHDMGYIAAYLGQQIHSGKLKPAEGVTFDVPNLGKQTIGKLNIVRVGPLVTFDKTNIDKYDF